MHSAATKNDVNNNTENSKLQDARNKMISLFILNIFIENNVNNQISQSSESVKILIITTLAPQKKFI